METSFTGRPYPKTTLFLGEQDLVSSLGDINTAQIPHHSLEENSRPQTLDAYLGPLIIDNQIFNDPRQYLRYYILPLYKINNSLQLFLFTRNRELNKLTQLTSELKFQVTAKINGLYPHPIQIST